MGRTFVFECSRCQYKAAVVGGVDRGFNCYVQTIVCRDCLLLYDVATRVRVAESQNRRFPQLRWRSLAVELEPTEQETSRFAWHNRLLFAATAESRWINLKPRCPVSKAHRVAAWQQPGKCPRCSTYLEKTVMPYRIWD
jgi:hypothetical protein